MESVTLMAATIAGKKAIFRVNLLWNKRRAEMSAKLGRWNSGLVLNFHRTGFALPDSDSLARLI
jgi:hypothetical protein